LAFTQPGSPLRGLGFDAPGQALPNLLPFFTQKHLGTLRLARTIQFAVADDLGGTLEKAYHCLSALGTETKKNQAMIVMIEGVISSRPAG